MRVSAVIPTLSPPPTLPQLVKTLNHLCDEVIVVVDGAEKRVEVGGAKVLQNGKWLGFPKTANRGLRSAQGDLLLLVNDDVFISSPSDLERALDLFSRLPPEVGTCNPTIYNPKRDVNEGLSKLLYLRGKFWVQNPSSRADTVVKARALEEDPRFYLSFNGCGSFLLLRREFLEKVGYYDENYSPFYWEDVDLSLRGYLKGFLHVHYPKAKVVHEGSTTTSKARRVLWKVFRRNHIYLMLKFTSQSKTLRWRTLLSTTATFLKAMELGALPSLFSSTPLGLQPFSEQVELKDVRFLSSLFRQEGGDKG